jgi:hypothetical protein
MRRRDVVVTVTAGATAGLAGCSSILGGGCSAPSGSASDALPDDTDRFQREGGLPGSSQTPDDAESSALAVYSDGSGTRALFTVTKYGDESTAREEAESASESDTGVSVGGDAVVGVLQAGAFVVSVVAPDEGSVESLVAASAFGDACTGDLEYLDGRAPGPATPTPGPDRRPQSLVRVGNRRGRMRRRDVLVTATAGATAGPAGCSSILGGGRSAPSGSASDALPEGDDQFQRQDGG